MNQIPLVLTSSRIIASPSESGLMKKFRASDPSETTNNNFPADKTLNEKFLELSIDNRLKGLTLNDETIKIEEEIPNQMVNVPDTVRVNAQYQNDVPLTTPPNNNTNFLENLIKMSQNDVSGISKYLDLDLNSKLTTWDKITSTSSTNQKFRMGAVVTSFLNSPFNFPFMKPDILAGAPTTGLSDSQGSCSTQSGSGSAVSKFNTKKNLIGAYTAEERKEKVDKFLEKKKKRQEVPTVRYQKRKDLADKRDRIQGKFVKTPKMYNHSDIAQQYKVVNEKMAFEGGIRNNSDVVLQDLTLSSGSLGKRMNKSDLFEDLSPSLE